MQGILRTSGSARDDALSHATAAIAVEEFEVNTSSTGNEAEEVSNVPVLLILPPRPSRVTFTTIEFHSCALILGDNPAVSAGPPLGAWGAVLSEIGEAVPSVILGLDEYETKRPPRRKRKALIVPKRIRVDWLRDAEVARNEMAKVEDEIKLIKMHRLKNATKGFWETVGDGFRSKRRRRSSYYRPLIRASLSRKSVSVDC